MRVLALDTTTRAGSIAIVDDDRVIVEMVGDSARSHAERLPADVMAALERAHVAPADVDLFAVASGPGSFTGLRIGIATIQGLAFVTSRPVVAVSALDALAASAAEPLAEGAMVAAWMDAHRGEVFSARYRVSTGQPFSIGRLEMIDTPAVASPAETMRWWADVGVMPDVVVGDGAVQFGHLLPASCRVLPPMALATIIARLARARAAAGQTVGPAGIQPLYVRRPDAELARDAKQADQAARMKAT